MVLFLDKSWFCLAPCFEFNLKRWIVSFSNYMWNRWWRACRFKDLSSNEIFSTLISQPGLWRLASQYLKFLMGSTIIITIYTTTKTITTPGTAIIFLISWNFADFQDNFFYWDASIHILENISCCFTFLGGWVGLLKVLQLFGFPWLTRFGCCFN